MAKLNLVAAPTFKAKVGVPVAGAEPVEVVMTFKHRTKAELDAWIKLRVNKDDTASFMEMVEGWELEDPYTPDNVELLLQNYIGTALAAFRVYVDQLIQNKAKN